MMNEKNRPKIYIVLLNWNGYDLTRECIFSLLNIKYNNYEVIVVDNGSDDDSYSKLYREFGEKVDFIKNEKNLGFAEGNNAGIKYSVEKGADYLLILNNDTIVDELFLDKMIDYAECDSKIGILGSKIYYHSEPNIIWFSGGYFSRLKAGMSVKGMDIEDNGDFNKVIDVDYITGCALLVKSEVVKKIGIFDKEYFNYAEDADFCFRAKREGYKVVFVPSSKVWHKVARSMKGNFSPFYLYFQSKNRLLLVKKNFSKIYLIYAVFIHIFCYIPYKLFIIWLKKEKKLKASLSLFFGTYDFLVGNKKSRFF